MDAALVFGKIHIVEWLADGELKTGRELFDELQPLGLMSKPKVDVSFTRVQNKAELLATIQSIGDECRVSRRVPLLHIETHGFANGLGSAVGDFILWPELMDALIPLNQLTELRLSIVLAACEGWWGLQMAQPSTRAAFLALLGPTKQINAGDLSKALQTFYKSIFAGRNGNAAFKAMNDAVDPANRTFGIVNAEMLFKTVYREFLKSTAEELSVRVERIVAIEVARFKASKGGMWRHEVDQAREMARAHVHAFDAQFDHYRTQFFFIDLFPDNDKRFPITIEDCRIAAN